MDGQSQLRIQLLTLLTYPLNDAKINVGSTQFRKLLNPTNLFIK